MPKKKKKSIEKYPIYFSQITSYFSLYILSRKCGVLVADVSGI